MAANNDNSRRKPMPRRRRRQGVSVLAVIVLLILALLMGAFAGYFIARKTDPHIHALQDAKGYVPLRFRMAIVPVCNVGCNLAMPLFLIGLLLASIGPFAEWLMLAGIAAFSLSVFFQLVTLPVEFNASRRAMRCLSGSGTLTDEQLKGSRKVLSAAAMTYVAALAVGLLSLLRLLLIAVSVSSRKNR